MAEIKTFPDFVPPEWETENVTESALTSNTVPDAIRSFPKVKTPLLLGEYVILTETMVLPSSAVIVNVP